MKKFYLLGLGAIMALTACSVNEPISVASGTPIDFSPFVDKSTKVTDAADVTTGTLPSFYVYGWRTKDNDVVQIFDNAHVTKSGNNWTYENTRYWESGYDYDFEALYPNNTNGVSFTAAKDGGTLSLSGNNATTDIVYAKVTTINTTSTPSPGPVNFTFKHLLSRVRFTFTNNFPTESNATISVSDVKISNASTDGSITPNTAQTWSSIAGSAAVSFPFSSTHSLVSSASAVTEHMYLIPETDKKYTIAFTVKLTQGSAETTYTHESASVTLSMEPGKSYNITAGIDASNINEDGALNPIEFTATVTGWESWTSGGDATIGTDSKQ